MEALAAVVVSSFTTAAIVPVMETSSLVPAAFVTTSEVSAFATTTIVATTKVTSSAIAAFVATAEAITIAAVSVVDMSAIVEVPATVKLMPAVEARAAIKAAEPWASADKDAAGEVTWPVVAVRRAVVRSISIVAVLAHRGWTNVDWPHSKADHDPLCMCVRRCHQANSKYGKKFYVSHFRPLLRSANPISIYCFT
jgi:hypothetical protein